MAEKKLLEKLRDAYIAAQLGSANGEALDALNAFCAFAENWLTEQAPTGISYTVDGLMLRLANGESYVLVSAPESAATSGAISVTGMDKLNAKAAPMRAADFPITGR